MGGHFTGTMLAACVDSTKSAHHVFKINLLILECSKPSTNTPDHTIRTFEKICSEKLSIVIARCFKVQLFLRLPIIKIVSSNRIPLQLTSAILSKVFTFKCSAKSLRMSQPVEQRWKYYMTYTSSVNCHHIRLNMHAQIWIQHISYL